MREANKLHYRPVWQSAIFSEDFINTFTTLEAVRIFYSSFLQTNQLFVLHKMQHRAQSTETISFPSMQIDSAETRPAADRRPTPSYNKVGVRSCWGRAKEKIHLASPLCDSYFIFQVLRMFSAVILMEGRKNTRLSFSDGAIQKTLSPHKYNVFESSSILCLWFIHFTSFFFHSSSEFQLDFISQHFETGVFTSQNWWTTCRCCAFFKHHKLQQSCFYHLRNVNISLELSETLSSSDTPDQKSIDRLQNWTELSCGF